ncbi:iron ABC transporter permease [Pelagibius sp. Alg239-R121]|uniref:FecCD family ABC transporter permease n=1 Tax=Pelagibius sp. Alg239-R121 TaxID=2993448 RepID=UPI0024A74D77|nr:iron ABC transporter permease [Pelagibius sp. Alg239-R121]
MAISSLAAGQVMTIALRRRQRTTLFLWALAGLLLVGFVVSVGWGAVGISLPQIIAIFGHALGLLSEHAVDDAGFQNSLWAFGRREETVLLAIRLPRACLAILVGAALAVSGAALQGLFRNPLADPGLIGVSTGAALAAATTIVLGNSLAIVLGQFFGFEPQVPGTSPFSFLALPLAAFCGGLISTFLVYRIASHAGQTDVATMLLAGVAMNAISAAGVGLLIFLSNDQQLRDLNFWMLGSLGGVTWTKILTVAPFIAGATIVLSLFARHLNALLLGEREAQHLGFQIQWTKRAVVLLVALATGASVAITGVIGFVGLVVPHLVRLTLGADHKTLLPASILLGASLMLFADLAARSVALPAELPIGILTSCVGGPFFLWLLVRSRSKGGW